MPRYNSILVNVTVLYVHYLNSLDRPPCTSCGSNQTAKQSWHELLLRRRVLCDNTCNLSDSFNGKSIVSLYSGHPIRSQTLLKQMIATVVPRPLLDSSWSLATMLWPTRSRFVHIHKSTAYRRRFGNLIKDFIENPNCCPSITTKTTHAALEYCCVNYKYIHRLFLRIV